MSCDLTLSPRKNISAAQFDRKDCRNGEANLQVAGHSSRDGILTNAASALTQTAGTAGGCEAAGPAIGGVDGVRQR